jgi:hypothetical protein
VAKKEPPVAKKTPLNLGEQREPARPFKRRPVLLAVSALLVFGWILFLAYLAIFT